jgi:hypothetical protein
MGSIKRKQTFQINSYRLIPNLDTHILHHVTVLWRAGGMEMQLDASFTSTLNHSELLYDASAISISWEGTPLLGDCGLALACNRASTIQFVGRQFSDWAMTYDGCNGAAIHVGQNMIQRDPENFPSLFVPFAANSKFARSLFLNFTSHTKKWNSLTFKSSSYCGRQHARKCCLLARLFQFLGLQLEVKVQLLCLHTKPWRRIVEWRCSSMRS